ncbi:hypothetical protein RI367_004087 [Sorochytrium milnesiophthora]
MALKQTSAASLHRARSPAASSSRHGGLVVTEFDDEDINNNRRRGASSVAGSSIRHRRSERSYGGGGSDNDDDNSHLGDDNGSEASDDVRDRQEAINQEHPFGFRPWKSALYKKHRSIERTAEDNIRESPSSHPAERHRYVGNVLWMLVFGIPLAAIYTVASALVMVLSAGAAREYATTLFHVAGYLLYPFGKWIERRDLAAQAEAATYWWSRGPSVVRPSPLYSSSSASAGAVFHSHDDDDDNAAHIDLHEQLSDDANQDTTPLLLVPSSISDPYTRIDSSRFTGLKRLIYTCVLVAVAAPPTMLVSVLCWMGVFTLPMAKVTHILTRNLYRNPLSLIIHFRPATAATAYISDQSVLLLCIYRAMGSKYYKYTVDGVNILFINMLPLVFVLLLNGYVLEPVFHVHSVLSDPLVVFTLSMTSVVPLSYFIGMGVASLSIQSSPAAGAVITATFGSIIDIILYWIALTEHKADLVSGSIVGSFIAALLLLPGLSMIAGGIRQKEQTFNAKSAGVTSTMLITSVIGSFVPTFFYQAFGTFELRCKACPAVSAEAHAPVVCQGCYYKIIDPHDDDVYKNTVIPLSIVCAGLLPLMYIIGLIFTLRTHKKHIYSQRPTTPQPTPVRAPVHPANEQTITSLSALPSPMVHPSIPLTKVLTSASAPLPEPADESRDEQHEQHEQSPSRQVKKMPSGSLLSSTATEDRIFPNAPISKARRGSAPSVSPLKRLNLSNSVYLQPTDPNLVYFKENAAVQGSEASNSQTVPAQAPLTGTFNSITSRAQERAFLGLDAVPTATTTASSSQQFDTADTSIRSLPDSHNNNNNNSLPRSNLHVQLASPTASAAGGHDDSHGGHSAPEWSKFKSTMVLLVGTMLFSMTAELLVESVESVVDDRPGAARFLGVAVFGLVPSITEFVNAIAFAMQGNIALSMEIGSAYAVQIALVQIPCVFAFSSWYNYGKLPLSSVAKDMFTLIFPQFDIYAVLFAVFLLSYVYIEGKTNYFKGSMLTLAYLVWLAAYYFASFKGFDERGSAEGNDVPVLFGFAQGARLPL